MTSAEVALALAAAALVYMDFLLRLSMSGDGGVTNDKQSESVARSKEQKVDGSDPEEFDRLDPEIKKRLLDSLKSQIAAMQTPENVAAGVALFNMTDAEIRQKLVASSRVPDSRSDDPGVSPQPSP